MAGVAQWIECQPVNQRVGGAIPCLGHMPGLRARSPSRGHARGNHTENQDGDVGRHTAPPRTTRTDRESNGKGV